MLLNSTFLLLVCTLLQRLSLIKNLEGRGKIIFPPYIVDSQTVLICLPVLWNL